MRLRTHSREAPRFAILAVLLFAIGCVQARCQVAAPSPPSPTPAVPGGAGAASAPTPSVPGPSGGVAEVPGGGAAANPPTTPPLPNTVGGPVQVTPLPEGMLGVENMSLSQLAGIHLASLSYGQWEYLKKALVAKAEQLLRENAPYVEYVPVDLVPYLEAEGKMSQEEKKKLRDTDRAYSRACEFKEYLDAFGPKNPFSGKGGLDALGFMLAHDLPPNPSGSGSKTNATPAPSQPPKGGVSQDTPSWTAPKDKQTENKNEPEDEVHVPEEYAPALTTPANPPEGEVSKAGSNQTFSVPGPSVSNASTTVSATTTPSASSSQGGTPFNVSATITEASGTYTVNQSGVLTANANGSATNSNVVTTVTSGAASPPGAAGASAKPMLATPKPAKTPPKSGTPASTNPAEKSVVAPAAEPPAASGVPGG